MAYAIVFQKGITMEKQTKTVYVIQKNDGKYLLFHGGGTYETNDIFHATFFDTYDWASKHTSFTNRIIVELFVTIEF